MKPGILELAGNNGRAATPRPCRSRPRRALALAGVFLAGLGAATALLAQPASAKAPPRDFYGVVPQVAIQPEDFAAMQSDGVGMVRQLFLWAAIEPYKGEYDWRLTDDVMARASAAGIEVFPVLYGIPAWAQSEKMNNRCGVTCAPKTPAARKGFARFAAAAVARYGPEGDFWTQPPPPPPPEPPPEPPPDPCLVPPLLCKAGTVAAKPIDTWQVWNEQNSPKYYGPKVNVRKYAQLLKVTSKAIRGEDRGAEVLLGGMWGPPGTDALVPTLRYLERLYDVRGSRRSFDSIAIHPYAGRFRTVKSQVRNAHRLTARAGDRKVGIWVTELGWASGGRKSEPLVKSPKMQAGLLRKAYRFLIRKRGPWRIRSVHWYSWRDTDTNTICEWCSQSGLRTADGGEKPAAGAFRGLPRSGG